MSTEVLEDMMESPTLTSVATTPRHQDRNGYGQLRLLARRGRELAAFEKLHALHQYMWVS
jgi:hypothetical protein